MEHRLRISPAVGFAAALALTFMPWASSAGAATPSAAQIEASRASGLAWLYKNQKGDGSWRVPAGLQVQATSAALDAMMNAGIKSGPAFYAGVSSLLNAEPSSTDGQSRQIDTLFRAGNDVSALNARLLSQATALYGSWGTLPGYSTSMADTAMAAVSSINTNPAYTVGNFGPILCNLVVAQQRPSGGWSYVGGLASTPANAIASASSASILPTAHTILLVQKLGALGFSQFSCGGPTLSTATIASNGVAFLKTKLNADGGFGENGSSGALETALAYRAIQSVNAGDASLGHAQGYLVATQKGDGSWGLGAGDPFQTALALQVYPATTLTSTAGDGMPDAVKTALNIPIGTPSRGVKPGNGQGVAGVTQPLVKIGATLGEAMSYSMVGNGGATPYQFSLASGGLPPGLSLNTNGVINGTPTVAGPFSFTLKQTDASAVVAYVNMQVSVTAPDNADTPTLPEWGAILLAAMLLGQASLARRRRSQP